MGTKGNDSFLSAFISSIKREIPLGFNKHDKFIPISKTFKEITTNEPYKRPVKRKGGPIKKLPPSLKEKQSSGLLKKSKAIKQEFNTETRQLEEVITIPRGITVKLEPATKGYSKHNIDKCCVLNCDSRRTKTSLIHVFPLDEVRRDLWIQQTGNPSLNLTPTSFICSKHFTSSDYIVGDKKRVTKILNNTAVPTLHLPDSTCSMVEYIDEEYLDEGLLNTTSVNETEWIVPKTEQSENNINNDDSETTQQEYNTIQTAEKLEQTSEDIDYEYLEDEFIIKREDKIVDDLSQSGSQELNNKDVKVEVQVDATEEEDDNDETVQFILDDNIDKEQLLQMLSNTNTQQHVDTLYQLQEFDQETVKHEQKPKVYQKSSKKLITNFHKLKRLQFDLGYRVERLKQDRVQLRKTQKEIDFMSGKVKRLKELKEKCDLEAKRKSIKPEAKKAEDLDPNPKQKHIYVDMLPQRYTDDVKNFAFSLYKNSPDSYLYLRHTLSNILPDLNLLKSMSEEGYKPSTVDVSSVKLNVETSSNTISAKISLL